MKVLVATKRVVDFNVRVRPRADGSGVDTAQAKKSLNPFDERAVEEAVRLKEAGVAQEVVAVTLGDPGAEEVLRTAMAFGADRGVRVEHEDELEPLAVSQALAAIAERERPDLALLGKQAIDDDSHQVGPMLAYRLGWGQASAASRIEPASGGVHVTCEVDGGQRVVALPLPAVVTADLELNEPRYLKLPDIMKAKKQPIERVPSTDLGVAGRARTRVLSVAEPPPRAPGIKVASVDELLDKLRHEAQAL